MDENTLQRSITAMIAGDKKTAQKLLHEFLTENPLHEEAWLMLSRVVDSKEDQKSCLEKVLILNPNNAEALANLGISGSFQPLSNKYQENTSNPVPTPEIPNTNLNDNDRRITTITNMTQRRILLILRSWWVIILITLAGVFVALYLSYFETPMYRTSARYLISPPGSLQTSRDFTDSIDSQDKLMATFAEVLDSRIIYEAALDRLGLESASISTITVVLPDTTILQTTTTGASPQRIALLTNIIGQEANSYIKNFYPFYEFTVLDSALIPKSSFSPNISRTVIVVTLLSIAVGILLAVIRAELHLFLENGRHGLDSEETQ